MESRGFPVYLWLGLSNTYAIGNIDECADSFNLVGAPTPEIVFMNLMSEHVYEIRTFLQQLSRRIPTGTKLFIHHDNYYNPMGHHDHSFLTLDSDWNVRQRSVPCWELPERCDATADRRKSLGNLWSAASDATRDPKNCESCNFYKRSQPWPHLVRANEFARTFPESIFHKNVNKVTVPQLALYLVENRFAIRREVRSWVKNTPTEALVKDYGLNNLRIFNYMVSAVRR